MENNSWNCLRCDFYEHRKPRKEGLTFWREFKACKRYPKEIEISEPERNWCGEFSTQIDVRK